MSGRKITNVIITLIVLGGLVLWVMGPRKTASRVKREVQRAWLLVTGRLVDVGGYRLHIEREGTGSPTVLMDAGLCQKLRSWGRVPSEVAKFTRVVTYERAGLGFSDVGPRPRTSEQNIDEMRRLLANAGITGPYVLVGHSFGGLNVRLYAARHPDDVVGIVLVDASHEGQYARFAALKSPEEGEAYLRHESGENCEGVDIPASGEQVRLAGALPTVPLVVLSADQNAPTPREQTPEMRQAREELQADLARLLPDSRHAVVENAGHFIQLDQPDFVVGAIRSVVESARNRIEVQSQTGKVKQSAAQT